MRAKPGLLLRPPVFGATFKRGYMLVNPTAQDLSSQVTFTRASAANCFVGGVLTSFAINAPRFGTYEIDGTYAGLIMEGARTNLLLWNRDFTNAAWVKLLGTAAKTATGIDGVANSASTLTATSDGATYLQTITAAASSRSFAIYVKRISGTGAIAVTQNGVDYTDVTVTSSWTRCSSLVASILNATPGIRIATSGDVIAVDYGQFEAGSFVSSPIATTTASVARSVDVCQLTSLSTKPWFNATEGTIFAYIKRGVETTGIFSTIFNLGDTTSNERMLINGLNSTSSNVAIDITDGGVSQFAVTTAVAGVNVASKTALAYKLNSCAVSVNGSTPTTDTSCTMPTVTQIDIGGPNSGGTQLYGAVNSVVYYPARLPNARLISITGS